MTFYCHEPIYFMTALRTSTTIAKTNQADETIKKNSTHVSSYISTPQQQFIYVKVRANKLIIHPSSTCKNRPNRDSNPGKVA